MNIEQRDIVFLNFPIPNGGYKPHLCLVISNNEIHETENFFIAVMLTSSKQNDVFSFWLNDDMIIHNLDKKTQIRLHLFGVFENDYVENKVSRMKIKPFERVLNKISNTVLSTNDII